MCQPLKELKDKITSLDNGSSIAIVMHENPDPDAIGAALGLTMLFKTWKPEVKCSKFYSGEISHSQNKTMINVLNVDMANLAEVGDAINEYAFFVLVDSLPDRSAPFVDNKDIKCNFVVDHHRNETKKAEITDIRSVGATSTIVFEYLQSEGVKFSSNNDLDTMVATALLIGIKTDTQDLITENVTNLDFEAYQQLMHFIDRGKLSSIINYPIPSYQLELRNNLEVEGNFKMDNGIFVGGVGHISGSKRDVLPILAYERSRLEDVNTAFIFAIVGDFICVSVRSINLAVDINAICQKIFGKEHAGGKQGAGAAKIPLDFLVVNTEAPQEVKDKQWDFVRSHLIDRIFHVIQNN